MSGQPPPAGPEQTPAAATPDGRPPDGLAARSRIYGDGWLRGSVESLGRAIEICAELGPRNHVAACALIADGSRRFGSDFEAELQRREIDPERFV